MNIEGVLIHIADTLQITETFKKREFVVEYAENPEYPETVKFEMIQDKCDILNSYNIGESVKLEFNLKGRKWTDPKTNEDKYFNTLSCWKIEKLGQSNMQSAPSKDWKQSGNDDSDDLPF